MFTLLISPHKYHISSVMNFLTDVAHCGHYQLSCESQDVSFKLLCCEPSQILLSAVNTLSPPCPGVYSPGVEIMLVVL